MGQTLKNIKYSGEMATHFAAKATHKISNIGDGVPFYLAIIASGVSGMLGMMEDVDTIGTVNQTAVYEEVSNGINMLTATLANSQAMIEQRAKLEEKAPKPGDLEKILDLTKNIAVTNYNMKDQLKEIISDIYLNGNADDGLVLSEKQTVDLFQQMRDLNIPKDSIPESMDLNSMLLYESIAEHLDEAWAEFKNPDNINSLSERYEFAKKISAEARSQNNNGEASLALGVALLAFISVFPAAMIIGSSTIKRLSDERPKKPLRHGDH